MIDNLLAERTISRHNRPYGFLQTASEDYGTAASDRVARLIRQASDIGGRCVISEVVSTQQRFLNNLYENLGRPTMLGVLGAVVNRDPVLYDEFGALVDYLSTSA